MIENQGDAVSGLYRCLTTLMTDECEILINHWHVIDIVKMFLRLYLIQLRRFEIETNIYNDHTKNE